MDVIIDFIKNFHPSKLGLGLWEILAITALTLMSLVLTNWLVSFLPTRKANLIMAIVRQTFNVAYYGAMVLVFLNAILTGDYEYVIILMFILAAFIVSSKIDYWYKLYDSFMDKRINKE